LESTSIESRIEVVYLLAIILTFMKSPQELEQIELQKEYARLTGKYELLNEQIAGEINEDNKETLKTRRNSIKKQMDLIWEQIGKGQIKNKDNRLQYSKFTDNLPQIDFAEVMEIITDLLKCFRQNRGDALLLLQENLSMSGDLCLRRISDELKRSTGDFKPYKLDFYLGGSLSEYGWLEQLSGFFGLEMKSSPEERVNLTIEKICNSVKSGSVIFIEIHKWDDISCQETTLTWFVDNFWLPLVSHLEDKNKYPRVKFVAIIVVDSALSASCFDLPCLCDESEQSLFRWLKLPLKNWEWIQTYPGVENSHSIILAERIFKASLQGIPTLVTRALEKEFILSNYY
jgi:hypothetical protein